MLGDREVAADREVDDRRDEIAWVGALVDEHAELGRPELGRRLVLGDDRASRAPPIPTPRPPDPPHREQPGEKHRGRQCERRAGRGEVVGEATGAVDELQRDDRGTGLQRRHDRELLADRERTGPGERGAVRRARRAAGLRRAGGPLEAGHLLDRAPRGDHGRADGCHRDAPSAAVHVPEQLVIREAVERSRDRVADAVALLARDRAARVADLDLGHGLACRHLVGDRPPGRVGDAVDEDPVPAVVRVVVPVPGRDLAEDPVLLQAGEVDVDGLDDVQVAVLSDRDVGLESVDLPAAIRGGGRRAGDDDRGDGNEPQETLHSTRMLSLRARAGCATDRWRCLEMTELALAASRTSGPAAA